MLRLSILAAVAALALLIAGCDDTGTKEAKAYECQMALNDGKYEKVLNASACSDMDKAAAYAGRAGYTSTRILSAMITGMEDPTKSFVSLIVTTEPTVAKENDLNTSKSIYGNLIGSNDSVRLNAEDCNKSHAVYSGLNRNQKDACFIRPIISSAQLAMGLELVKRDGNSTNVNPDSLADMINSGELDLIASAMGGSDSDAAAAVEDVKKEICEVQTGATSGVAFDACMAGGVTAVGIEAYIATLD